jgi:hypothetical protein
MSSLRILSLSLIAAVALATCSKKSAEPTAPPPPDNPNPPTLQYVPDFQTNNQSISFTPPDEGLVIEVVSVFFQHAGAGGIQVATDFVPGQVAKGDAKVVHVTTAWTWQQTDYYALGLRVRRSGQTKTFPLCCLGCNHQGGVLVLGPCQ